MISISYATQVGATVATRTLKRYTLFEEEEAELEGN